MPFGFSGVADDLCQCYRAGLVGVRQLKVNPSHALADIPSAMESSGETIRIMCPNLTCRKILAVPVTARDKTVRCKACSTNIKIPGTKNAGDSASSLLETAKKKSGT